MTQRRLRIIRFLKWTGAALCLLLVVGTAVSIARPWSGFVGGRLLFLQDGTVVSLECSKRVWYDSTLKKYKAQLDAKLDTRIVIPLWLVAIPVGVPTVILFLISRRPRPRGLCQRCGYDLRGNESGRCPECGTPLPVARPLAALAGREAKNE